MQFTGLPIQNVLILAAAAAVFVTVLYLLKLRKRRFEVPFSPLWNQVLASQKSYSDWWNRLKRLLSWLIHIVLVALLAFAMLGPHFKDEVLTGRHILVLLDNSASMAAVDVSGGINRLDIARRKAAEILETVSSQDRIMVAAFNTRIEPLSPFTNDTSLLELPLQNLRVAATGTTYEQALAFAADSLRQKGQAELVIISDGAGLEGKSFENFNFDPETTIRHLKIGERSDNLAITAFNARRYLANKLDFELFVQIQSFFDREIDAELQIYADDRLVETRPLKLEANQVYQTFYPSQAVAGEKIEARIKVTSRDARDVFPLDDSAYALLPAAKKLRVQLVTDGNLFLEGTLLLNPNIEVVRTRLNEYDVNETFDVTIFDRVAPPIPERGNFVYFAPSGTDSPFDIQGEINNPIITDLKKSHPLMRWITLKDVNIGKSVKFRRKSGDDAVASAFGDPIIMTRRESNTQYERNLVAIGFDVRNSDFPMRVAFPVFIFNLLDYLTIDDEDFIASYETGDSWQISLPVDANQSTKSAVMHEPDGSKKTVSIFDGRTMFYGETPGFYRLEINTPDNLNAAQSNILLAANMNNPEESNIAPFQLELPDAQVSDQSEALVFQRHQLWIWILLLVSLALMLEWWTYNRRVTQ